MQPLKSIILNGKNIPVPIPLLNLSELVQWVEKTFVSEGSSITRFVIDGQNIEKFSFRAIDNKNRIEIKIDSPSDLAVQALDTIRNFSDVILRGIKQLAVDLWQLEASIKKPAGIVSLKEDCQFISDLTDHSHLLLSDLQFESSSYRELTRQFKESSSQLFFALNHCDWKSSARILLNRLEPILKSLVVECEIIQVKVLSSTHSRKILFSAAKSG